MTNNRTEENISRTIIITGASDGIGAAAANALHRKGHRIVVVGRSSQKTEAVARDIGAEYFLADFAKLDDVRRLAVDLLNAYPRIDVLANNAGGILGDQTKTADGFETTFQVNHLAPFLLTHMLMDRLIESKASIIQTASAGARLSGKLNIDDLEHDRDFTPLLAYGTAKLANILFTRELHRRFHHQGISSAAFHPGVVATSFGDQSSGLMKLFTSNRLVRAFLSTPEKGAGQLVWLADGKPDLDWRSGEYFEQYKPARRNNPQALDPGLAQQLWEKSERLLELTK